MRKRMSIIGMAVGTLCLLTPSVILAKGYMGGRGDIVVDEEPVPVVTEDSSGVPDTVDGPLNDNMADAGKLFGDLYVILRHLGYPDEQKLVPETNPEGIPVLTNGVQLFVKSDTLFGGEPVLTVADSDSYADTDRRDYGWYAAEVGVNPDGTPIYAAAQSPYPAQCVQPVASYERWGNISSKTGLTKNRLPLIITYDATWGRSECEVGKIDGTVTADPATGELTIPVNEYFIEPGATWPDEYNGTVIYANGVRWTDLVGEVHFGRLNLSRAPEAVLQAAFDEAINSINSIDTIAISVDAAGRLLLTKNVYDEFVVNPNTGEPVLLDTVTKAIDSPLENLALYVKLMRDGHLIIPALERTPIDRSKNGGIPIWKMLELEDGPADAALRPTLDIAKLVSNGLGSLVDATSVEDYYTYYQCLDSGGVLTPCLCWDYDPAQPELDRVLVACENVASRSISTAETCPATTDPNNSIVCEGPFTGVVNVAADNPDATDLKFAASFLAAAADKSGDISVDMVVYLNSILGINKVVDELDSDGSIINYSIHPLYFNFNGVSGYSRTATFSGPRAAVDVLESADSNTWSKTHVTLFDSNGDPGSQYFYIDNINLNHSQGFPNYEMATDNILGFTQQADDNLSVIEFIHTYQIPELR